MFRVPSNPTNPTFDDTFTVSFWRWLASGKAERHDWRARRDAAARAAGVNQRAAIRAAQDEARARFQARKDEHERRQDRP